MDFEIVAVPLVLVAVGVGRLIALLSRGKRPSQSVAPRVQILFGAAAVVVAVSLAFPIYLLGNTAIFGNAYLWGETGNRMSTPAFGIPNTISFVDRLDAAQFFSTVVALVLLGLLFAWPRVAPLWFLAIAAARLLVFVREIPSRSDDPVYTGFLDADPLLILAVILVVLALRDNRRLVASTCAAEMPRKVGLS